MRNRMGLIRCLLCFSKAAQPYDAIVVSINLNLREKVASPNIVLKKNLLTRINRIPYPLNDNPLYLIKGDLVVTLVIEATQLLLLIKYVI